MGFEIPETGTLLIEGGLLAGAEIVVRLPLSPPAYFAWQNAADAYDSAETPDEKRANLPGLYEVFLKYGFVSWDLTRGGVPIPATVEEMLTLDHEAMFGAALAWRRKTAVTVTVPLPETTPKPRSIGGGRTAGSRHGKSTESGTSD